MACAALLAFVWCLALAGAPAGVEPLPIAAEGSESESTESEGGARKAAGEGETDSESGSALAPSRTSDAASARACAPEPDRGSHAAPIVVASVRAILSVFAPPPLLAQTFYPGSHARIAQLLIASVPTRGPTILS